MGVDPYFLHADNSKFIDSSLILNYVTAFNDVHNFWLPLEQYKSLFNENFLSYKLSLETFDINNVMLEKSPLRIMDFDARLNSRKASEGWNNKYYPDTLKEYLKIFDNYLSLCIENKVRPLMVLYPVSECWSKYFNRKILAEFYHFVNEAVKKYPEAGFIDGWKIKGFDDSDFFDADHLNIKGAAKFSAILNSVILQLEKS